MRSDDATTTPRRLAEACERAAGEFEDLAFMSKERVKYHEQMGYKERAERLTANAKEASEDAIQLRALAAALRGAKPLGHLEHAGHQYMLTLGDA